LLRHRSCPEFTVRRLCYQIKSCQRLLAIEISWIS